MRAVQSLEAVITAELIFARSTALFSTPASKRVSSGGSGKRSRSSILPRTIFGSGFGSAKIAGATESRASRTQACPSSCTLQPSRRDAFAMISSVSSFKTVTEITILPFLSASSLLMRASSSRTARSASSIACCFRNSKRWRSASSLAFFAASLAASRSSSSLRKRSASSMAASLNSSSRCLSASASAIAASTFLLRSSSSFILCRS
mmetsp:Transcript_4100/g.6858  ORF Transcript_4100/g.6858 Transcript_4100/m.6858 type:complete len:207 (-) Transcript_4100:7-627(-)